MSTLTTVNPIHIDLFEQQIFFSGGLWGVNSQYHYFLWRNLPQLIQILWATLLKSWVLNAVGTDSEVHILPTGVYIYTQVLDEIKDTQIFTEYSQMFTNNNFERDGNIKNGNP